MSIFICELCDHPVDSDIEELYQITIGNKTFEVCQACWEYDQESKEKKI